MKALIIANGLAPTQAIARRLASLADLVICADGGANHAARLGIRPDVILGDLDSISAATARTFRSVPTLLVRDQNSTDLEKAIRYALLHRYAEIDVLGATGRRVDHTAGNLGCFKKYGSRCTLRFIDDEGELSLVRNKAAVEAGKGAIISLLPLDRCTGVTTANLRYALKNGVLELGVREGTSNRATARVVTISLKKGTLLLFRPHLSRRS